MLFIHIPLHLRTAYEVKYPNIRDCTFLAQNGGNGWADTFHLDRCSNLINLRGIRQISFNAVKTQAVFQGGVLNAEMVATAFVNSTSASNPTCNCVGLLGAILGGGLSPTIGLYGLGIDQLLSKPLVTASGDLTHVNSSHSDLWFALQGAGASFGIVTFATIKAYSVFNDTAWTGPLPFTPDKIEAVVGAINGLDLRPEMEIEFYYATTGAPDYNPTVLAIPFCVGNATAGRDAFATIFTVGPAIDGTTGVPYNQWNAGENGMCITS